MNTYNRHLFPADIRSYTVWLVYRFNPGPRDIEDLLTERGITVLWRTEGESGMGSWRAGQLS